MSRRRQRILALIPTLGGGGAERVVMTLAKHLDRSRFRIALAVIDMRGAVYRDQIPDDVEFIDLKASRVRHALVKIVALIWRSKPDVVFSTLGHLNVALAMIRIFLPRRMRTVARETIVVSLALRRYRFRALWAMLYRWFYRMHDEVVCQSQDMRTDLIENFRLPPEKTRLIHNPVDVDRILTLAGQSAALPAIPPGATRLVAAGRLDYQKGFDLLIEAIVSLNDPSIHVMLLGEGPWEARLKQQAAQSGLADRIHFVGFQANPYAWFARADAFVLSSRYEGFPNVVLEALACGAPVIATPAPGGTQEILDGVEGCVVAESVSAEALMRAIGLWLKRPRGRVAEAVVQRYRLERIICEYQAVLSAAGPT